MSRTQKLHEAGNRTSVEFDLGNRADVQTLRECGAGVQDGRASLGGLNLVFAGAGKDALGRDGYRLTRDGADLRIQSASRAGRLAGLLAAPEFLASGARARVQRLLFNRRFYKHEVFRRGEQGAALQHYTERFWANLCRELVRRHFNGVVLYLSGEPFPLLADYGSYERYAALPAEVRAGNRASFAQFLETARRYGLETLVQQYVTKFPAKLGQALGIPYYDLADPAATTADFKHPGVYDFHRELYANFFRDLPGLSRLMINFEAAPNSTEFCRELLLPTLAGLKRPPDLLFRLWYMTNPEALCEWIAAYPGDCMVSHKVMDTMDAYVHPAPDSRVREWKRWFAEKRLAVNWNYLIGPCHNCGSNISWRHWSDPEFMYTLLARAQQLGADGFNFHAFVELLAGAFPSGDVVGDDERALGTLNQFHLEAAVDVVRGGRFERADWEARTAAHLAIQRPAGRKVFAAMRDSSRAEIMHLLQFPLTTSEGYAVEARRQLAQHPLYHPPANLLLDHQQEADPHLLWSYIDKCLPSRSYPADLQPIIDYVDPAKPKTAQNPEVLARTMVALGRGSQGIAEREWRTFGLATEARRRGAVWLREVVSNRWLAEACAHDIRSAIALYRLYFPLSPVRAVACVRRAIAELRGLETLIARQGMPYIHMQEDYAPATDIAALRKLQKHLSRPYPRAAWDAYVTSVKLYNDVRRHVRPWRIYSAATMAKAERLLRASLREARRAEDALARPRSARPSRWPEFRERLASWSGFVAQELAWLTPPEMVCGNDWAPWQPLVHDNCFGYGGFAWADFLAFFEPIPRDKGLKIQCTARRDASALYIRMREDGVAGKDRRARWHALEGNRDLSGVMRCFLSVAGHKSQVAGQGKTGRTAKSSSSTWDLRPETGDILHLFSAIPVGPVVTARPMVCGGRNRFDMRAERLAPDCAASFRYEADAWEGMLRVPFAAVGRTPRAGESWRLNLAANTPIKRNHAVSWCKGYEVGPGNPERMGVLRFA